MQSGLITIEGKIINCPYYEIEKLCKKIINEFCCESIENQKKFSDFARDYTYFEPYFDFVVGVLGYSLLKPWLQQNKILCGNYENRTYTIKYYSKLLDSYMPIQYNKEVLGFSSDVDLQIKPFMQKSNFYNCFITPNLMELVPFDRGGHRELGKQLLNLAMIKDKELCERMIRLDFENTDTAEVLMWYFPLLRFDDYLFNKDNFALVYRSDNISEKQKKLILDLKKLNGQNFIGDQVLNSPHETFDWSYKFYSEERRCLNENKRL